MVLTTVLSSIRYLGYDVDTDLVDRLHSFITTNLLIGMALLVSFKQFGGRPIECATPETFNNAMEEYAENYCWSRDTYFVPMDEQVPLASEDRQQARVSYYQWVPFYLLIQALCFRLPSVVWALTNSYSGLRVRDLLRMSTDESNMHQQPRTANITAMSHHMQNALRFHRRRKNRGAHRPHGWARCLNLPYSAFYCTVLYLSVKLWTLINCTIQLLAMNRLLNNSADRGWFGYTNVVRLLNGTTWDRSGLFPRITLCDVQMRQLGGVHLHTLQCVLVINLFTEKIFVLLWFWFVLLMLLTTASLLYWTLVVCVPRCARLFVARHLALSELSFDATEDRDELERFVNQYLRADGVFLLRLVAMHSGIVVCNELVQQLWQRFYRIDQYVQAVVNQDINLTDNHNHKQHRDNLNELAKEPLTPRHPAQQEQLIRNRLLARGRQARQQLALQQHNDQSEIDDELFKMGILKSGATNTGGAAVKKQVQIDMEPQQSLEEDWVTARQSERTNND